MSSSPVTILAASTDHEFQEVQQLITEYAASRQFDAALAGLAKELDTLSTYYEFVLLARYETQAAGCVALQRLSATVGEMKRLYVRPEYRGHGLGHALVAAFIEGARQFGYTCLRLDSHPHMVAAQRLYQSFGFTEIERYNNNPIEGIRFFELRL